MDKNRIGGVSGGTPLHLLLYSEDMRISKVLRRLVGENSPAVALDLCKKLEIAVRNQTNAAYICRSFEFLLESMVTILKQCPTECCSEQASTVLGLIGYINRSDFSIYKKYITKTYDSNRALQKYMMMALKKTISCDAVNLDLIIYSEGLLTVLKDYLENAEAANNFVAVSEAIAEFSKNYKRTFECHFTDIVDIVVGWHLEVDQQHSLKLHCSLVLQQFSQYFLKNLDFTYGLLGQFLEDIVTFGEDVAEESSPEKSRRKAEVRVGVFVGAFNSILKSVSNRTEFVGLAAASGGQEIIAEALITSKASAIISQSAKQSLSMILASEETILNINDFLSVIFVNNYYTMLKLSNIEEILDLQLQQFEHFNDKQQFSLLYLILCIVRQLRTQLPCSLVNLIFKTSNNPLSTLKFTQNAKLLRLYMKLYHDVLIIKNVPLLQEAYKHIKLDIYGAIEILESGEANKVATAELTLNFYLAALSALTTQTSSIIGMYALYPSIVDLLIVNCQAANLQFWQNHQILHNSLLSAIVVHCQKNHNYRPTSRLLLNEDLFAPDEKLSPTSENFSTILKFLAQILSKANILNIHILNIILNWLGQLLIECRDSAGILQYNIDFVSIGKSIGVAAQKSPHESARCMEILLKYTVLNSEILTCFRDVSIHLIDSVDSKIRHVYSVVFARLPLDVSLTQSSDESNALLQRESKIYELHQWYKCTTHYSPMCQKYFKPFLNRIELSPSDELSKRQNIDQFFLMLLAKCWRAQSREIAIEYQLEASCSTKMLTGWLQYEAARYCVQNKLRTTMGKPQDTFLAIEGQIMKYARVLASLKNDCIGNNEVASLDQLVMSQRNSRVLLGFLENLEKHIYSAAEGTAFASLPPEMPAKTFFRINAQTCNEWFKRIRSGVNLVAMHSMEPEMVIRYSQCILNTEKLSDLHMERTITSLVEALLYCGEADTLQGLYLWIKTKTEKSYTWIQHAAEQSKGHKEQAAEGYAKILFEYEKTMDVTLKEFLIVQLLDCLYYTWQWSKMREFLKLYESFLNESNASSNISNRRSSTHLNMIETLYYGYNNASRSDEVSQALLDFSEWPTTSSSELKSDKCAIASFSSYSLLRKIEDSCIAQITSLNNKSRLSTGMQQAIHHGLQESLRYNCNLQNNAHLQDYIILNNVFQRLCDNESSYTLLEFGETSEQSTTVLTKCLLWTLLFEQRANRNGNMVGHNKHHSLYLDISASARREGNLNLCRTMLERFFVAKGFVEPSLISISKNMQNNVYTIDIEDTELLCGFREVAKYLYVNTAGQPLEAIHLGAAYCCQLMQHVSQFPHLHNPEASANMLLTMADWLMQRGSSNMMESHQLQQLLRQLPDVPEMHLTCDNTSSIIPSAEKAVGKLMNAATLQQNDTGESWCVFGNWCYRWGKKVVEANTSEKYSNRLSQHDLAAIKAVVGGEALDAEAITQLVNVLNSHQLNVFDGVEEIDSNEVISNEIIENDLRKISIFANKPVEQITAIVEIWRKAHRSIYVYYEMAAKAYFKYLSIETVHTETSRRECNAGDSTFVTVTLRLLRLVVKHAIGLQEVLEEGLSTTPLRPWKVIIPQLFSRLNHHEPYVRKSVSELLCRLAKDRPHLIIFPAVVGAHQELKAELPRCDEQRTAAVDNKFYIPNQNKTAAALSTCFSSLLTTLSQQMPETVLHVQLLVKELKRITLLWEEYWLHALAQLHAEYSTLFSELEIESKNCLTSHADRIKLKYNILLNYVVIDLQKIAAVTETNAETNYERTFQDRYNPYIRNTIDELKKPFNVGNVGKPNENWIKIKQLYNLFQQRSMRGSASTFKISDLSPVLASMKNTPISMLGVDTFEKNPIYIKSVDNAVYILPTKTRPKKLSFAGSDGRKYTYLFKGLEDLHLDERIMQFLSISNSMMERSKDPLTANANLFKAQHYSVIPLGTQSGLISWVDGVTPLFAIYKKWQQRDIALKQQQNERPSPAAVYKNVQQLSIAPATRPSDIFYNKLTPLLADQNLKVTDPRKQWPLPVLRRVLEELTKETPKYLLAKELWCHAANAADWRKSVRNYSLSVAVMSVIGYIIGLGDRHLDNVLIKLSTGEIVHIDYNVCFEKGKTLRVPEKVPFRMTPNLEEALGITGIEGTFRLGCEHVLKTLRKERETLLTLLEAFVYDPLVDWTISDDGTTTTAARYTSAYTAANSIAALTNHTLFTTTDTTKSINTTPTMRFNNHDDRKHQGGNEFSRQTIQIRFNEMKPYWTHYKNELILKLTNIGSEIELLLTKREAILQAEQERNNLTKQLAMIRELEALGSAMGSHALNTITQRYDAYKQNAAAFDAAKRNVGKHHSDIKILLERYFDRLMVPSLAFDLTSAKRQLYDQHQQEILIPANEFDVIHDFLSERSSKSLYDEYVFARNEMNKMLMQKSHRISECLELLLQYANVMQYYPRSRIHQNRLVRFERWYQQLLVNGDIKGTEQLNAATLLIDIENFLEEETKASIGTKLEKTWALQYSAALEKVWIEQNFDLHKAINYLKVLKQLTTVVPFEVTASAIESFVDTCSPHNENILQKCMLRLLSKANQNFLLYEDTAVDESDTLLLERQIDYIDLTLGICRIVFPSAKNQSGDVFAALELLQSTLCSLRKLKSAFEFPLLERIVRLFMLDTYLELQSYLDIMCSTPAPTSPSPSNFSELHQLSSREDSTTDEFFGLLAELYGLFDDFEIQLSKLQKIAADVLERLSHSDCTEFTQSGTFGRILNVLSNSDLKCNTISEIFCIARKHVGSLNSNNLQTIYDIRLISTPITHYINQLQRSSLGGLASLFTHILYTDFHSASVASDVDVVDDAADTLSQSLCQNLLMSLQHNCNFKNQQLKVWLNTKWLEHYTLVASAHFWVNEQMLKSDVHLMYGHIVYKDKLLSSLQSAKQSLTTWKHSVTKIQSVLGAHTATVIEHLNWSVDSNQNLNAMKDSFMEYVNLQNQQYGFYLHISTQLLDQLEILLEFEMWAEQEEVQKEGSSKVNSLDIVRQWQYANDQWRQSAAAITSVEQAIVQLLDPEDKIDQCWIANISGLLDEITFSVQRRLASLENEEQTIQENLYAEGQQLQSLIDNPMRMRIRHLLKMISKSDKKPSSDLKNESLAALTPPATGVAHVRDLQHLLKLFYAKLGELQLQLISRDFNPKTTLLELNTKISDLLCAAEKNESELFQLVQRLVQNAKNKTITSPTNSPTGNIINNIGFGDNHGVITGADKDKKVVSQCEQKRNVYAVSVWKRIRMKLEGRDPDSSRRSTVAEQVHFIIREAMNPDNLAVLYEGWTPWV